MPHSFHQLYSHIVWATKERLPLIEETNREKILDCIASACKKGHVVPVSCNAMPDHVHLLVRLPPTIAPATFIGEIKGASSHNFNHHGDVRTPIKWQEGYGIISLRETDLPKVVTYIENQQSIHANRNASRLLETIDETDMSTSP